jgi:DNA-binding transcriptional LysR family regulator
MDRFQAMTVFVAVAEEESFAGGARRLAMSPPAVTRAVAALEDRLGVKLLTRTTRLVRATEAGQRYLEDARRILAELDEADETAAGINAEPRGQLSITAPVLFGRMFVIPGVVEYLRRYSAMKVSALFLDRVVNLLEEGMDVGVRIGELPDSTMRAISVGFVRRVVCASPAYLKQNGLPSAPLDLPQHAVIAARGLSPGVEWKFAGNGETLAMRLRPRLTVTSNDAAIEAAVQGFGLTRLLSYQIAPYLASGQLEIVLSAFEPSRWPIHVLHREGRRASAKVRTFVDLMVARLRAEAALTG